MVLCGRLAFPSVTLELKWLRSLPAARITARIWTSASPMAMC